MLTALHVKRDGTIEKVRASKDLPLRSELPEGEDYLCVHCGRSVVLRKNYLGSRIPHFAHKNGTKCKFWEVESEEHMTIKSYVADVFEKIADYVELEKRDSIFRGEYYPDVYVEWGNRKIAVEVQCSNKSINAITKKTQWYSKHGIYTLWLWRYPENLSSSESSWPNYQTSIQERLMYDWYGFIPFITTEGEVHLAFQKQAISKTKWDIETISFKLTPDTIFSWFDFKKANVKLFGPFKAVIPESITYDLLNWDYYTLPELSLLEDKMFKILDIEPCPNGYILNTGQGLYFAPQLPNIPEWPNIREKYVVLRGGEIKPLKGFLGDIREVWILFKRQGEVFYLKSIRGREYLFSSNKKTREELKSVIKNLAKDRDKRAEIKLYGLYGNKVQLIFRFKEGTKVFQGNIMKKKGEINERKYQKIIKFRAF
ncbi:protein of unknown function (plasmid) [Thermococcus nautili]|uniref:competence protein CoiA n=1 Tax=Thermococcus nautili TaxID=195522 RepID=UPI002557A583|nr:competence protein CoiA family protein [Thermococcus nautili]CAI1494128.1 protein of unknown function [Thermococcus nautili]